MPRSRVGMVSVIKQGVREMMPSVGWSRVVWWMSTTREMSRLMTRQWLFMMGSMAEFWVGGG